MKDYKLKLRNLLDFPGFYYESIKRELKRKLIYEGRSFRSGLSRINFSRKLKREPCFCTVILSQIVTWYKKDDVTKKNRLSHVTSCLEFVTKKACLFEVQSLDHKLDS
jgi:hypothetical protein